MNKDYPMSNTNPPSVPRLPNGGIDAAALHTAALAQFTSDLATHRFWHLVPEAGGATTGMFDAQTGLCYPLADELKAFLKAHPFLHVQDAGNKYQATLQTANRQLWAYLHQGDNFYLNDGKTKTSESRVAGLSGWRLPTKEELESFAKADDNPHREGQIYRLHGRCYWLTADGRCDVDTGCWGVDSNNIGHIFATHNHWKNLSTEALLVDLADRGWQLVSPDGKARFLSPATNTAWKGFDHPSLMTALTASGMHLDSVRADEFLSHQIETTVLGSQIETVGKSIGGDIRPISSISSIFSLF